MKLTVKALREKRKKDAVADSPEARVDRLKVDDASIIRCEGCDVLSFTDLCPVCAARLVRSSRQNRVAS